MARNLHPASEGWVRVTLTLTSKKPFSEDDLKQMASVGKPEEYEWAKVEQYGNKVKVIYRHQSKVPATA